MAYRKAAISYGVHIASVTFKGKTSTPSSEELKKWQSQAEDCKSVDSRSTGSKETTLCFQSLCHCDAGEGTGATLPASELRLDTVQAADVSIGPILTAFSLVSWVERSSRREAAGAGPCVNAPGAGPQSISP